MDKLNLCSEGLYQIVNFPSGQIDNRLLEVGFLPGRNLYIICNNALGVQVRINRATYLFNEVVASIIYVKKMEE
jgi:Fe2+ transport system protein FeoA